MGVAADLVERTGAAMLCRLALCLHREHHKEVPHQTSGHGQERGASACAAGVPRTLSEGHPMRAFGVVTDATGEQGLAPRPSTTNDETRLSR